MNRDQHRERLQALRDTGPKVSSWDRWAAQVAKHNAKVEWEQIGFFVCWALGLCTLVALVVVYFRMP